MIPGEFRETMSEHLETFRLVLFELSRSDFWFIVFLLLVAVLLWLALRGVRTWYWKQNRILESLEDMQEIMERMLELQLRMAKKPAKESRLLHTLFDEQETEDDREPGKQRTPDLAGPAPQGIREEPLRKPGAKGDNRSTADTEGEIPVGETGRSGDRSERKYPLPPIK